MGCCGAGAEAGRAGGCGRLTEIAAAVLPAPGLVDTFGVLVIVRLAVVAPVVVSRTRDAVLVRVGRLGEIRAVVSESRTHSGEMQNLE